MPASNDSADRRAIPALKVAQWLPEWNEVNFDASQSRARPPKYFLLFAMPASQLRSLSGIFRRSTEGGLARSLDLGIQRRHDVKRSEEIHDFVRHGFPWSALSIQRRESREYDDLKKPGWLPTAIVVNILKSDDTRNGHAVHVSDLIKINDETDTAANLSLPAAFDQPSWQPSGIAPIEIIDGQHRLWAFENRQFAEGYSLPVVAFYGLDISWQAYLFYTINIKPKRINTSLAFDLYPLLRTEDWLERFEGHPIYRQTRAQEITEALWSYPDSPWHDRIDMLGNRGSRSVTQAAWIRSLMATLVKSYESRRVRIGGLFGAPIGEHRPVLGWSRSQQSAFVILIWQELQSAVRHSTDRWATQIRREERAGAAGEDPAFSGRFSLLNTDQGVRALLAVFNDLCYVAADRLDLADLTSDEVSEGTSEAAITSALGAFREAAVGAFMRELALSLAGYDWRTSGIPRLTEQERASKARFRGSTGYKELRSDLLQQAATATGIVGETAVSVFDQLGF